MKKQVALLTTALLATSFVLGATSCAGKDVNELMVSQVSTASSTQNVSALFSDLKDVDSSSMDKYGLVVTTTATENSDGDVTSGTYKLFDLKANAEIAGTSVTINFPGENDTSFLYYTMDKITDGFYVAKKIQYQKPHVPEGGTTPPWYEWSTAASIPTYTLYGKNGVIAENLKGIVSTTNGTFTTNEGEVYYVDVNGDVKSTKDPLAKYMTATSDYNKVGDYYYNSVSSGLYNIYDANGNYVRNFDMYTEFEMPISLDYTTWTVGNRLFVQYYEMLPESEKKYDVMMTMAMYDDEAILFYDGMQKYNIVTKYYDLEKEKVKDVDFDYVVSYEMPNNDNEDIAVLRVSEIKDKQVMQKSVVQSFDEKGKVAVDLQKLVPGATGYSYNKENDYVMLNDGDMVYVCQGEDVIGKFPAGKVTFKNNVAYMTNWVGDEGFLYIYNLDGTIAKVVELEDVAIGIDGFSVLFDGNLVYETEDGVFVYDTKAKSDKCVATANDGEVVTVDVNNAYVKSLVTTNDSWKRTYAFLVGEASDVTFKSDNYEQSEYEEFSAVRVGTGVLYVAYGDPKEEDGATEEKADVYTAYYVSTPIIK